MSEKPNEVDAIKSCIEAVAPLDKKVRQRVAKYITQWADDESADDKDEPFGFAAAVQR